MKENAARPLLSLFDLTMIVVSLVIGMGIFRTPHDVAHAAGNPAIFFAAWIFGGIVALFGALTFAEIGSRYPVTGGFYKIYSYCYHPAIAFMINCIILISNAASVSAVALIGAGYLQGIMPVEYQGQYFKQGVALGAVIVFFFVNYLGFKMSVRTQNFLMMAKMGILAFICIGAFTGGGDASAVEVQSSGAAMTTMDYIRAFGVAMIAVSFSFGGYQQTINFGGEVKNPQRIIPKAIFMGIAIIVGFYLLVNFSYFRVLGFDGIQLSKNDLAARHAQQMVGGYAYHVMSFLLFFSVLGYVNIGLMSNPRAMYAMAEDKVLPKSLMRMNQKQVLTVSLPIFAAIAVLTLVFSNEFEKILDRVIFLDSIGLATAVGSIFVLRRKTKHLDDSGAAIYKMKWYPFMPLVYIAAYLFVSVSILIKDPGAGLIGAALLAIFFVIYLFTRYRNQQSVQ
jgi:APA family basic amino acid/polyamine antiporter